MEDNKAEPKKVQELKLEEKKDERKDEKKEEKKEENKEEKKEERKEERKEAEKRSNLHPVTLPPLILPSKKADAVQPPAEEPVQE